MSKLSLVQQCISNPHPRIDIGVDCSDETILKRQEKNAADWERPSCVDHAGARACDVNVIVASFARQGIAPRDIPGRVGQFLDNTKIPNFYEAFEIVQNAQTLFDELPPKVRRAMDNNPAFMEDFIKDSTNFDFLVKEGVLVPQVKPDPDDAPLDKKTFKDIMKKSKPMETNVSEVK